MTNSFKRLSLSIALPLSLLVSQITPALCADFKRDVIYHIITDRFHNGRTDNDDPIQSKGMFDPTKKNWWAYWGGDFEGIRQKLPYIKGIGATAIMISPPIDNINKPINDEHGKMMAPYHAYWARDFTRIEEHFADPKDPDAAWKDFDSLVKAAHDAGIKVIIDLPINHTSPYNHGEFGSLFDGGQFRSDVEGDKNKYFHHLPLISNWNDRYQLQYGTLFYLGDLAPENSYIDTYLQIAVQRFQKRGVDGTRLDAAKHANWGWQQALANTLYNYRDHLIVGEWIYLSTSEPLYKDAVKFANKGGMSLFDYALATAVRKAFSSKGSNGAAASKDHSEGFIEVDKVIAQEYKDFADADALVTFIDNHDIPRLLSLNGDNADMELATAFLLTCRGIPCIYYGTEQYLHDDTRGGEDPYDRPQMNSFDQNSGLYKKIQSLCAIRKANPAFIHGRQQSLQVAPDTYVFERRFGDDTAVIAINKNKSKAMPVSFTTSLPQSRYTDSLNGSFGGVPLQVETGGTIRNFASPPHSVTIWQTVSEEKNSQKQPLIGSVRPPVVSGGASAEIAGGGFGKDRGKVTVGKEEASIKTWTAESIAFTAPGLSPGTQPVKVTTSAGAVSNEGQMTIVESRLIPIQFVLKNAPVSPPDLSPDKAQDQQLFITGNAVSLGNGKKTWMDAAGPMLFSENRDFILTVPMPSNQKVELKFVILDRNGKVVREESKAHQYQVPAFGTWTVQTKWVD